MNPNFISLGNLMKKIDLSSSDSEDLNECLKKDIKGKGTYRRILTSGDGSGGSMTGESQRRDVMRAVVVMGFMKEDVSISDNRINLRVTVNYTMHVQNQRTFNTSKLFFRTFNTLTKLLLGSPSPSTPPNYSSGSSRNAECSNCKHLRRKISKTDPNEYLKLFVTQQIADRRGFITRMGPEVNIARNEVGQLNALIFGLKASKDVGGECRDTNHLCGGLIDDNIKRNRRSRLIAIMLTVAKEEIVEKQKQLNLLASLLLAAASLLAASLLAASLLAASLLMEI
ncbi:hypothetical protein Tco_0705324 [Tanacetum coccineum]|uniref:Uncharacterized protein n=1 Tax=Tanacetum coccineum TaxID=301880 RepID=A0ABQ4Y699_9ASTR